MKTNLSILFSIGILAIAALACQAVGGTATESAPIEASPATQAADLPSLPPVSASKGIGIACAGIRAGGVTCLTENGWQTFTSENSDLPSDYVDAGALCPEGRIAISHYDGISIFNGQTWENINSSGNYSSVNGIACEANGGIWVAHYQGVSHYSNGSWTTYPSTDLATGEFVNDLVYGVSVAPDGKVWVSTSRSVAVFDQGKWTIYQEGQGFDEAVFFDSITTDTLNRPWAGVSDGLYVFENGKWTKVKKQDYDSPQDISIDSRGQVWIATISNGATTYNRNSWNTYNTASKHLSSDQVNGLAADTLGRVWVGTTFGLSVFDGTNWQTFHMDNSDIGDNYVEFVVVSNDGPSLPALTDKPKTGLTGSLNNVNNQPMPGMRVEICVEPLSSQFSGETPCSDQPFSLSTQTDANGAFTFTDVPAGYYVIVSETGDGWAQLTDEFGIGSERTLLPAGQPYDIGVLTLKE